MLPSRHVIVSLSLGTIIWSFSQSLFAGILCFAFGVFVDADHIVEYVIHHRFKNFNFSHIYQTCLKWSRQEEQISIPKLFLVFHIAEIAILLWLGFIFTQNVYLLSIALGYTVHLIMDALVSAIKPSTYFLTLRLKNKFKTENLLKIY